MLKRWLDKVSSGVLFNQLKPKHMELEIGKYYDVYRWESPNIMTTVVNVKLTDYLISSEPNKNDYVFVANDGEQFLFPEDGEFEFKLLR